MKDIKIIQGKEIEPNQEEVMELLECKKESPVFEEIKMEYQNLLPEVKRLIEPKAAIAIDHIRENYQNSILQAGIEVLYLVLTIGKDITKYSQMFFEKGDYVKGMVVDAMSDSCLFQLEEQLLVDVKHICEMHERGIRHRYEAPQNIPMELQKAAFEAVDGDNSLGISITSGYMIDPIKSVVQVFELTKDVSMFEVEHDCSKCDNINCSMRKVKKICVTVMMQDKNTIFSCEVGANLMEEFSNHQIYMPAVCGGNGKCKKCKIRLLQGTLAVTKEDENCFSEEELLDGFRLSCMAKVYEPITVELCAEKEQDFHILGIKNSTDAQMGRKDEIYGIAIDIGTTTLAISLVGVQTGQIYDTYTAINQQRAYGADVITRMQASNNGKREILKKSIQVDLEKGIQKLLQHNNVLKEKIVRIVIAGNTTMLHLLRGYSCETLGVYPFIPVSIAFEYLRYQELFNSGLFNETDVVLLPGISTFVGADIVSGLYSCAFQHTNEISLLIDLGTNGEMAIGNQDKIFVTSTAAGPAFEGGNIEWGIGSVPGAICAAKMEQSHLGIETIAGKLPTGICGTGVIEITAELLKAGRIDETGLLQEPYFETGYPLADTGGGEKIVFTQKDVREIQLAKAAIRAGMETLMLRYGVSVEEIDKVYIAGGFGFHLDLSKAVSIGMIPETLQKKTIVAGNTSLQGAIQLLLYIDQEKEIVKMIESATEISLSMDKEFQEFYMEHMMFED